MRRASSPYDNNKFVQHQSLPTGPAQVGPGSITYTTSTGPDGRILYHQFKAVAASYQTPNGLVSGIQWVPAESTSVLPPGAQNIPPAGVTDPAGWHGTSYTGSHKDDYKEWQRAEEKRRKQEEKEPKRHREQDGRNDSEYDSRTSSRDRRKSVSSGTPIPPVPVQFPTMGTVPMYPTHPNMATGYPPNPYPNYGSLSQQPTVGPVYPSAYTDHARSASSSIPEVTRQFKDMVMDRNKDHPERARKISGYGRPSESEHQHDRARSRTSSANYSVHPEKYQSAPYAPVIPYPPEKPVQTSPYPPASHYITPSPSMRSAEVSSSGSAGSTGYSGSNYSAPPARNLSEPIARSTTPFGGPSPQVYPRGHILEGQPIQITNPRSRAPSRAPSPSPVTKPTALMGKSPHMPVATIPGELKQLPAPEAFSRPLNAANSFAPFDLMKIQNMDDIYDPKYPKMPSILSTHDIYPEDWKRCMQDLARCWSGQLPVPSSPNAPRRSTLARDLVDLWNNSFFFHRGVELMLYKGREKRTGIHAGDPSVRLPKYDDADDLSSSSSSSSSSSLDSDDSDYANRVTDAYGRPLAGQVDMQEARRRRLEAKEDKRRRRKEKKARRKARARDRTYSLYITCLARRPPGVPYSTRPGVVQGGFGSAAVPTGYIPSGPTVPAGYMPPGPAPTGYVPPGYGQPQGIQMSRSHGYGNGY